jgi:hypothetical protein
MTARFARSFVYRPAVLLFYPVFFAATSLAVLPEVGIHGAVAFALFALGWLVFGRLLVFAYFAFIVAKLSSVRTARVFCSALVDGAAVYVVWRIDSHCLWGVLAGIVISEAAFWLPEPQAGA